jgi:hypothetical protein
MLVGGFRKGSAHAEDADILPIENAAGLQTFHVRGGGSPRLNAQPLREGDQWLNPYHKYPGKSLASLKLHVEARAKE